MLFVHETLDSCVLLFKHIFNIEGQTFVNAPLAHTNHENL